MVRKKLILWSFYNYASAIIFIIFTLYFSQWLVIDRGLSDFWFNFTYIASSALFLCSVPFAAEIVDRNGTRLFWLRITTVSAFFAFLVTSTIAAFYPEHYIFAAVTFTFAVWLYLFAGVFYSSLLSDVSRPETYGLATGWSQFSDWIGEISGVLIALPLITGALILWGNAGRSQAFIPASILYLIFSLPMLIGYREEKRNVMVTAHDGMSTWRRALALFRTNNLGWFFIAFFFFNDATITASNNFTIYLDRVFGVNDTIKSYLLLGILVSSAIGALISGRLVDRIGFKKALTGVLLGWIIILPLLAVITDFRLFTIVAIAMGIWFGAVYVISRVLIAHLAAPSQLSTAFTYYSLMERFATLVGPLAWGLIVTFVPSQHSLNYHLAVLGMAVFVILGFFFARKIPSQVGNQ